MRYLLINPPWDFAGSIYFGCREPHLPLEFGYSRALLEEAGHTVLVIDAQLEHLSLREVRERAISFRPDFTVLTTAPSYLFWRCAPPELRIPMQAADDIRDIAGTLVIVGPHASSTPRSALRKLRADVVVIGECEDILPKLAGEWTSVSSICYQHAGEIHIQGGKNSSDMSKLPALRWPDKWVRLHTHHHHRFDAAPEAPGAEMESSRGCPYHCSFCAKNDFRDSFRRRPLGIIEEELDRLVKQGIEYVYFIDEIFLPNAAVLEAIAHRNIHFGIQTRIDLWNKEMIDLAGRAGCVSIEAGVESITESGRALLDKKCKLSTAEITERLLYAKERVAFVQANLLDSREDPPADVAAWREQLRERGVWSNQPVPLFPYPGSPDYVRRWGPPDDDAWDRAHEYYLKSFAEFSDLQDARPASLEQLECV